MHIDKHMYSRAKQDARHITEIATQLEYLAQLEKDGVVTIEEQTSTDYEQRRRREIKNMLSNIYLVLDLHEVKGIADQIFNPDFKPID